MVMSDLPNGGALARAYLVKDDASYAVNQRVCIVRPRKMISEFLAYQANRSWGLVELFLSGATREKLDPILDACKAVYVNDRDEDQQVDFKGKAKTFTRTYDFLATILPYGVQEWEKLSIFLNFLISKLPAPVEEDLAKGILDAIDMDSDHGDVQRRRAALQTIPRQRVLPWLADRDGVWDDLQEVSEPSRGRREHQRLGRDPEDLHPRDEHFPQGRWKMISHHVDLSPKMVK